MPRRQPRPVAGTPAPLCGEGAGGGAPAPLCGEGVRGRGTKTTFAGRCRPANTTDRAGDSPSQREHQGRQRAAAPKATAQQRGRAAREPPHRKGGTTPNPGGNHPPEGAKAPTVWGDAHAGGQGQQGGAF